MTQSVARLAEFWRVLARVRRLRVQRRLREVVDARRDERLAADEVAARIAALERHAEERLRVLASCRREPRAGRQWHATLRAHDALAPMLRGHLAEAQTAHAAAREKAAQALAGWRRETMRQEDASARARECLVRTRETG
ncbi:hypothetical protein DR64_806 [Paraburkholderia xenovorans LB400]|uniref:Flagellar FliJ protein n=1 Tax=Paraburkholderia xenovorans (strain LB400) TaxID=266265 RepID=Q141X7_PARXL|nr:hypothetical protein [Paraburkholderia xenovorans]ABE29862.1 hypothetical protein Bxe_A3117 [Paraburkholderia xenovorans LB400]AIP30496.1 hypothetical protein DR64_806 [Paraburkholderia xenovorans LB400]